MEKCILFFGANFYQLPAIKFIKKRYSIPLVVLSGREDDPGLKLADIPVIVDILNPDEVEKKVKSLNLDPVAATTVCTDWPLPSVGRINDKYKLNGISENTALMGSDKIRMKEAFRNHRVPSAVFKTVENYEDLKSILDSIEYPFFLKTPRGGGSKGIIRIDSPAETEKMESVFNVNNNSEAIVEEALSGIEFGAQIVVENGLIKYCFIHNDTVTDPPVQVPIGHSIPFFHSSEKLSKEVKDILQLAVNALEVESGVCNCDLILDSKRNEVKVIEISPRVGATGLTEIIEISYGINLCETAVRISMGESVESIDEKLIIPSAVLVIRSPESGKLVDIKIPQEKGILSSIKSKQGEEVKKFTTGPDILGMIYCDGENAKDAEDRLERLHDEIVINLNKNS